MQDRIKIVNKDGELEVSVGPSRKMSSLIFFAGLAVGWVVSTLAAVVEFVNTGNALGQPLTWTRLAGWLVFGVALLYPALILAYGKEVLTINEGKLIIKNQILGWTIGTRKLILQEIQDIRLFEYKGSALSLEFSWIKWGVGGGMIAILYPYKRTFQFGRLISEKEAKGIIKLIQKNLPRTVTSNE